MQVIKRETCSRRQEQQRETAKVGYILVCFEKKHVKVQGKTAPHEKVRKEQQQQPTSMDTTTPLLSDATAAEESRNAMVAAAHNPGG